MHQFKTVQCPQWGRGEFDSTLAYGPAVQKPDSRVGESGGVCFQTSVSSAQQKYGVQHYFQSLGKEAFHKFVIEYIDNLFYNLFFSLHLEVFPLHTSSIHQIASLVPHLSLFNLRKKKTQPVESFQWSLLISTLRISTHFPVPIHIVSKKR